jgi:hypothetical protein
VVAVVQADGVDRSRSREGGAESLTGQVEAGPLRVVEGRGGVAKAVAGQERTVDVRGQVGNVHGHVIRAGNQDTGAFVAR